MLAARQPILASVRRDAWVEVDLGALEYNVATVRSWLKPGTQLMAVVKGDGYGHGAVAVAELLVASGADWLAVASVDEGCQLRAAGINHPILLLSPCPTWALGTAIEADLQLTLTSATPLTDIANAAQKASKSACLQVKVDTGMHRLGVQPDQLPTVLNAIGQHKQLKLTGIFSHLAKADDRECVDWQTTNFHNALTQLQNSELRPDLIHISSSDAMRLFPETHLDMVRPGLILYGLESRSVSKVVKPVMSVRARINHLQNIASGQAVGYNLTWTAQRPSKIASIPIGYADGVDRRLSNRMEGILLGKRVKQVGLISMDQMLFDVTDAPHCQEGDVITLIGSEGADMAAGPGHHAHTLYLSDWANQLDTITYELACRLRARMPRIYTRHAVGPALKDN